MFCSNCGNKVPSNSTFCSQCGQPLNKIKSNSLSLPSLKNNKKGIIKIIAIIILIIGIPATIYSYNNTPEKRIVGKWMAYKNLNRNDHEIFEFKEDGTVLIGDKSNDTNKRYRLEKLDKKNVKLVLSERGNEAKYNERPVIKFINKNSFELYDTNSSNEIITFERIK